MKEPLLIHAHMNVISYVSSGASFSLPTIDGKLGFYRERDKLPLEKRLSLKNYFVTLKEESEDPKNRSREDQ